ncbi:YL1 nuclear protein-domain-containing protein, partial [Pseudoneurospora amorphoporcata]
MTTIDFNPDPKQKHADFLLSKHINQEDWSDSSDDSHVETPNDGQAGQQPQQQVEWLATSRAKRSTAGNRMKSMLANEEPAAEDSDLELLFAEDEDDAGFTDEDKDDASDVHMDSSSDDEDDKDGAAADDLEGEKELERQAREKRNAQRKRKAQEAIPIKFRKKVRIEQPPSASTGDSAAGSPAPSTTGTTPAASSVRQGPTSRPPRPKKKSERTSWLPTPADMPTRASERRTTKMSKEQLHQKMIDDEIRRKKLMEKMEKNAKRLEALKKPPMTQAERLAEAALVEKRNEKSLNRWEEAEKVREEERLRKIAALNNRKLDGPVVTFWSGIQTLEEGQQKHVGKMVSMEEKPVRKKRQSVSATLAAQEAAEKEKAKAEEASKQTSSAEKGDIPMTEATTKQDNKSEIPVEKTDLSTALPEQPKEPISTPDVVMKDAPEQPQQTQLPQPLTLAPLRGPMAPPPIPPPPPPLETKPAPSSSGVLAAPVLAPPAGVAPPMLDAQIPGLAFPFSNGMSNVLAPPNTASPLSMPQSSGGLGAPTPAPAPAPAPTPAPPVMSAPVTSASTTTLTFAPAHIPAPTPAVDLPPRDTSSPATKILTTTIQTKQAPTPPSSQPATVGPEKSNKDNTSVVLKKDDKGEKDSKGEESNKEKKFENAEKGPAGPQEGSTAPTDQPAEGEEGKTVNKVTRSCIILQNFDEAAIKDKQVQTQIIFGRRMEKLAKPAHPPLCVVTGHPARYRDPKTGLPYFNAYAYREIQRVHRGDYKFSALLGAYVGSGTYAAKGVPERFLNPNGKRSTPKEDPAKLAKLKEAQEAEEKDKEKQAAASEQKAAKEVEAGDRDKKLDNVQATELPPLREPKVPLQLPRRASGTEVLTKARSKSKDTRPSEQLKRTTSTSSLPATMTMTGPVVRAKLEPIDDVALPPTKAASAPAQPTSKPAAAAAAAGAAKPSPPQMSTSTSTPPLQTQAQFKLVDDADTQTQSPPPPADPTPSSSSKAQATPKAAQSQPQSQPSQAPDSTPNSASAPAPAPTTPAEQ